MKNWREKLDAFLTLNERDILTSAGKISKMVADQLALEKYNRYHQNRLIEEATVEALEDDKVLKEIETKVMQQTKKGDHHRG